VQYVLLGIVIVAVVAALIYLSSRHTAAACPTCHRARVSGRTKCPFCGTPYSTPPPHRKRTLPPFSRKTDAPDESPRLVMVQGVSKGTRYPLNQNRLNIGRAAGNDVRIEGPLISRQHAQITRHDGRYYLYDRESTNGTYVNGTTDRPASTDKPATSFNSEIRFSPFRYRVQQPPARRSRLVSTSLHQHLYQPPVILIYLTAT